MVLQLELRASTPNIQGRMQVPQEALAPTADMTGGGIQRLDSVKINGFPRDPALQFLDDRT